MAKTKIVVVCGPTATGKSKLANHLARRFGGEVVSADSMQLYSGLPIGTAAVTSEEAGGIPQHLVGFLPPEQPFSVADYVALARPIIDEVAAKNALPILCGGTGLYLSALLEGRIFTNEKPDVMLRTALQKQLEEEGAAAMLLRLGKDDPAYADTLSPADEKRILRGLEQWQLTGKTRRMRDVESRGERPYHTLSIGLNFTSREVLYAHINARVDAMLLQGILQEAEWVYHNRNCFGTAAQTIGYKEFFPYFSGKATLEACTVQLKQATRNYAKRQLTWFRAMPSLQWLMADDADMLHKAEALVAAFLLKKES